ncbi:MAG TPA: molybdopterin-dependent oxidoreductase [Burkholderiaceae bacterium]|nr:molybdopterin-dependent oxidoreductase [Burkholderiaceae bacterium]
MDPLPLSRRRFLQISAATFGAAASSPTLSATAPAAGPDKTVATYCEMCFWRCGGLGVVREGKLHAFVGNPLDPASNGRLCPRGTGAPGSHVEPDRVRTPLIRVGARGKEEFKSVTWDEALDHVAARLQKIKAEQGPESVAFFKHGIGAKFIEHALKSWGVVNSAAPSYAQCRGPRDVGFVLTYGTGLGSPEPLDIANTKTLVLIGSHLGENMHNTQVQEFAEFLGRGGKLIVADPRLSVAASKAAHWLPVKPGTDIALINAWMNVIVTEGLYDQAFVKDYGHGFEEFARFIRTQTPDWAAAETGIPAATIRATARAMAATRPATLIHPGRRSNWYGDDSQRARAVALLNALMGNWGRKGGFFLQHTVKLAPYPLPPYPKSAKGKADNPGGKYPFADEELSTGIREATLTGQPYPIKAWVVYSTNLVFTLPDPRKTLAAIDKLDFLVVIDTIGSEIAGYADVVLPEAMFLERYDDINSVWGRRGWVALRQPVVPAPSPEQKPGWWIGKQLANKLGVPQAIPFSDIEEYLAARVEKAGLSYAQLKRDGVIVGPVKPNYVEEGGKIEFDTPSGKVEFFSEQIKKAGFDPVPRYVRPATAPAGMVRLITGRSPVHTFGRTQGNPILHDMQPTNEVWIATPLAAKLGVADGQKVRLRNQDGITSLPVAARLTERLRPDCVYMVYGFGHTSRMSRLSFEMGASASHLNSSYRTDPLTGSTSIHTNFVAILKEPAAPPPKPAAAQAVPAGASTPTVTEA